MGTVHLTAYRAFVNCTPDLALGRALGHADSGAGAPQVRKRVSILLRYSMGRYCSSVVRTSISTHRYWYWEARYMCTAHVYTYVQVLPVCAGQSVLYRPLYGLIARRLLSGQSEGQHIQPYNF